MKNRIIQLIPTIVVLVGLSFAQVSYWCIYSNGFCYATWVSHIYQYFTNPFYNFSFYFFPIALILIFIPRKIFNSWLKLAAWMIPLSIFYIAMTPVNWTGIGLNLFPFYRDDAARVAGIVFSVVSLILIAWKYFSLYRHRHALKKTDQTTLNH